MSLRTHLAVIAAAVTLAACGDDDAPDPVGTTPAPPAETATATASPEATPEPTPTETPEAFATTGPEEEDGGDEDGNRVPVELEVSADAVTPKRVEVPAFLGLRVTLRNETGVVHPVTLDGEALTQLPPGGEVEVEVEGLKPGEHVLEATGSGRATLVAVRAGG